MQAIFLTLLVISLIAAKVKFTAWQRAEGRKTLLKDLRILLSKDDLQFEEEGLGFTLRGKAVIVYMNLDECDEEDEYVFLDRRRGLPAVIRRIGDKVTTVRLDAKEVDLEAHPHRWDANELLKLVTERRRAFSSR